MSAGFAADLSDAQIHAFPIPAAPLFYNPFTPQ